jgi:uncharacterized protein
VQRATIRFYGDLADIAGADRAGEVEVPVGDPRSVKDAIESCGVPHTEVDLVLVDAVSVAFTARLRGGERVSVYPPFHSLDVPTLVRPEPLQPGRFVADVHLGRMAELLRILGFDTRYRNDADDAELARCAAAEQRWLLTRDRGLLMRASVTHGYLVRCDDPKAQAAEVVHRFDLRDALTPGVRCARCNGVLHPAPKHAVAHLLEPGTRREHDTFLQCAACEQVYWEGSHTPALRAFVDEIARAPRPRDGPAC